MWFGRRILILHLFYLTFSCWNYQIFKSQNWRQKQAFTLHGTYRINTELYLSIRYQLWVMGFILRHLSLITMASDLLLPFSQILLAQEQEHTQNTSVKIPVAVNDGSVPRPSQQLVRSDKWWMINFVTRHSDLWPNLRFCAVLSILCGCVASNSSVSLISFNYIMRTCETWIFYILLSEAPMATPCENEKARICNPYWHHDVCLCRVMRAQGIRIRAISVAARFHTWQRAGIWNPSKPKHFGPHT